MPIMTAFDSKIERSWNNKEEIMRLLTGELRRINPGANDRVFAPRVARIKGLLDGCGDMGARAFLCQLRLDKEFVL